MVLRFFLLAVVFILLSCTEAKFNNPYDPDSPNRSVDYQGETYQTVLIGSQVWFKRNLNYNVEGSKCYGEGGKVYNSETTEFDITLSNTEIQANCSKYGRLYDWATAMGIDTKYNKEKWNGSDVKHKGICPNGWHLPSNAEWNVLMKFVNPECSDNNDCDGAGTKLKAADGWNLSDGWNLYSGVPKGTDNFGFSALPGGVGDSDGSFLSVGYHGVWWSASEYGSDYANGMRMSYGSEYVLYNDYGKDDLFSVRCIKD